MSSSSCNDASDMLSHLPTALLDELVSDVLKVAPSFRATFLASLGSRIHASAVRVLFRTLVFKDDARLFDGASVSIVTSAIASVLANPKRYAHAVKEVVVCEPDIAGSAATNPLDGQGRAAVRRESIAVDFPDNFRPLDATAVSRILEVCCNLEKLSWESSFPPPDGICETLVSHNPRLMRFSFSPDSRSGHSSSRLNAIKWDCPSLPLLSSLPLTSLHLSRISQAGARSLSVLLSNVGEYSTLEELSVDIVWLDDQLCEKIVEAGGKLRKLQIGTSGTKLTDKGMIALIEGCDALVELTVDEVQGRLSRGLWTKPITFPPNLKHFRIVVGENGPHHSWTKDHLWSLHAIPLGSLTSLSIVRREMLPRIENTVPVYDAITDDVLTLKPVPKEFLDKFRGARLLTRFECDWWAWSIPDLKVVLENCPHLERLKICLDAPFTKLMGLTSSFAPLTSLQTLSVSVNPLHAPGKSPVPLPLSQLSLATPRESPVMKAKSVLPQLLDFDQMQTQTCLPNDNGGDPSMPLLRDVRRFVRKCLKLSLLEWYGKAGRGSWIIARPLPATSKISINVSVEYIPPMISNEDWLVIMREQEMGQISNNGWVPSDIVRRGQSWTGDGAKALEAEDLIRRDREDRDSLHLTENGMKDRQVRLREGGRKARLSSVSTSSSASGASDSPHSNQLSTPTGSTKSQSPGQTSSPLPTAAQSWMLSSVSEDVLGHPVSSVTESGLHSGRPVKERARSMNALGSPSHSSEWSGSKQTRSGANSVPGSGRGSHKSGNGRGRGGPSPRRRATSGDPAPPTVDGVGKGRAGRGSGRGQGTAGEERRKSWRESTR